MVYQNITYVETKDENEEDDNEINSEVNSSLGVATVKQNQEGLGMMAGGADSLTQTRKEKMGMMSDAAGSFKLSRRNFLKKQQSMLTISEGDVFTSNSFRRSKLIKREIDVDPNTENFKVSIVAYHGMRWCVDLLLASPFPFLYAAVADCLTHMAPSLGAVFATGFILLLTQQSFDALGRLMAVIAGQESLNRAVCFGTIVSQFLVVSGGFYRTVNPVVSAFCPIRYAFSGISKICFKAAHSFWCTPDRASSWRGVTWCALEQSGAISDLSYRGIKIVDSYEEPNFGYDVAALIIIILVLRTACYLTALSRWRANHDPHQDTNQEMIVIEAIWGDVSFLGR